MSGTPKIDMNLEDMFENAGKVSAFLKAMANDNRLVILCKLAEGEKNVGQLENLLGIRQPTLSQQLARLRADNMVTTRRDSKQVYYSLASDEVRQVIGLLYQSSRSPNGDGESAQAA